MKEIYSIHSSCKISVVQTFLVGGNFPQFRQKNYSKIDIHGLFWNMHEKTSHL